ncbi:unnamed protein product, partial [Effrenium voratum]
TSAPSIWQVAESSTMKTVVLLAAQVLSAGSVVSRQSHFGPGGCVSAWVADAHCVVRTACSLQPSFATYAVRLVCVDKDGGRVLHSFQEGGFDAEETFDTRLSCHHCESGDAEAVQVLLSQSAGTAGRGEMKASAQLQSLQQEVRKLAADEALMAHMVEDLQTRVNRSEAREARALRGQRAPVEISGNAAADGPPPVALAAAFAFAPAPSPVFLESSGLAPASAVAPSPDSFETSLLVGAAPAGSPAPVAASPSMAAASLLLGAAPASAPAFAPAGPVPEVLVAQPRKKREVSAKMADMWPTGTSRAPLALASADAQGGALTGHEHRRV